MTYSQTDALFDLDFLHSDSDWQPRATSFFNPQTIIFAKGSQATKWRKEFVTKICDCYPNAKILKKNDIPHSKIMISGTRLIDRHYEGKQTLVLGELLDSVRRSNETGNSCPNYWHFSPYSFCPYGCQYCYLAGTIGIKFSPSVKIFVNLPEILSKIDDVARHLQKPTAFYLGKLQDGLALDPLTGFTKTMIPFFANHPYARLTILTKSSYVDNLVSEKHNGHTTISWSLNPETIHHQYEPNTPSLNARLHAMKKCSDAGYPVRAMLMPIIPVENWKEHYAKLIDEIVTQIPIQRLTMGGICSYKTALSLMNAKLTKDNTLNNNVEKQKNTPDGRIRYPQKCRIEMYTFILGCIQKHNPELPVSLCMEEMDVIRSVGLSNNIGQCICPL